MCAWLTGPGSRRGRGLGMPHVPFFVRRELMCGKLHCAHLFMRKSRRFSTEGIQSTADFYSWWREVLFQPLMHFSTPSLFKVWLYSKDCLYKIGICFFSWYIPCAKSEYRSGDFNGRNFFHMLVFWVDGAEAELHSHISGSSNTALPFWL